MVVAELAKGASAQAAAAVVRSLMVKTAPVRLVQGPIAVTMVSAELLAVEVGDAMPPVATRYSCAVVGIVAPVLLLPQV